MSAIVPQVLTSPALRTMARQGRALVRRMTGRKRRLLAFLECSEPYSELVASALPVLCERYDLDCEVLPVSAPGRSAVPEPERLAAYARQDARLLADRFNLTPTALETMEQTQRGNRLRDRLGHYASGMIWFEGEWYWGIDRLHHLERRLGASETDLLFPVRPEHDERTGGTFDMFFSLRSPYSYLAMMRVFDLARRWGAGLRLRPVLPMVMRALPVPLAKRIYIVRDCMREAERLGLPFGRIADPVGAGVERGLAVWALARKAGREEAFLQSFFTGVFAEGIDAAKDSGLERITGRAGLDWPTVRCSLSDNGWKDIVEENRSALFEGGLWGVPSFRVGDRMTFGQDRLWQVGEWLSEGQSDASR